MSLARYRLRGEPQQKIRAEHLGRAAVVYVRQSSRQQVLEHTESTRLQYALAERAAALGWARSQIMVIDDDLGVSAATADSRKGFARLVTEVTMGRVGVVLGIEMSRLARTGRDWHQLLELCSLSGVLLADPDGVYDPGFYNDRLLLGLKGTMSEAELYLIRQRMLSGKLAKAERGELAVPLPIGYVRRPSGEVVLDPDEQAQHVVRLVFSAFRRLGTLNGVLRYLVGQEIQLPVRTHSGPSKGEIEWRRPTRETLQIMLHNPVYAGYYAYGRRQVEPRRKVPGRPSTGRVVKEAGEWLGPLAGRGAGHQTPEEYEANVARMAANRQTAATPGAPRDGSALLSGLLRCGRCGGHRMTVQYHDGSGAARSAHGYTCAFYQVNYGTGGRCQHIAGRALDDWVTSQVLDAVAPAALEVSMAAAAQAEDERAMLDKLWRQRLERARYAAGRARRQYQLAEPENRLVVRQLETDWEEALAGAGPLEADYQRVTQEQPETLTPAERAALQALARDLAAAGRTKGRIADALNAEGFRPPRRTSRFSAQQVRTLISQRGIRGQQKGRPAVLTGLGPGEWSVPGLAAELGMPTASIYNWIYRGWITARHAPATRNWIITADDEQMRQLRERRARPPGFCTRARWAPPEQEQEPGEKQGTQP